MFGRPPISRFGLEAVIPRLRGDNYNTYFDGNKYHTSTAAVPKQHVETRQFLRRSRMVSGCRLSSYSTRSTSQRAIFNSEKAIRQFGTNTIDLNQAGIQEKEYDVNVFEKLKRNTKQTEVSSPAGMLFNKDLRQEGQTTEGLTLDQSLVHLNTVTVHPVVVSSCVNLTVRPSHNSTSTWSKFTYQELPSYGSNLLYSQLQREFRRNLEESLVPAYDFSNLRSTDAPPINPYVPSLYSGLEPNARLHVNIAIIRPQSHPASPSLLVLKRSRSILDWPRKWELPSFHMFNCTTSTALWAMIQDWTRSETGLSVDRILGSFRCWQSSHWHEGQRKDRLQLNYLVTIKQEKQMRVQGARNESWMWIQRDDVKDLKIKPKVRRVLQHAFRCAESGGDYHKGVAYPRLLSLRD